MPWQRVAIAGATHVPVAAALGWAVLPLAHATGGRAAPSLTVGLALLVVALLAVRIWRATSPAAFGLAVAISLAALLVCVLTPPGWFGGTAAASYGYAAGLLLLVTGYASTPRRRAALAALVVGAGVVQFGWALVPWWGHGTSEAPMIGTFYWHNQYAAFLLAPALLGLGLLLANRSPWRLAGGVGAVVASTGVVYSSSRAALAALAVGWVAVGAWALLVGVREQGSSTRRASTLLRWVAVSAVTAGFVVLLSGPPLFPSRATPLAAAQARADSGQSVAVNGGYRVEFWREALAVGAHHPVTGAGYGTLARASRGITPASWARSPLAHNGLLQPFADGGLLLALPFGVGVALVLAGLLRRLGLDRLPSRRRRQRLTSADGLKPKTPYPDRVLVGAAAFSGLALATHSVVDFDWSYPVLFGLAAVVAGLALGARATAASTRPVDAVSPRHRTAAVLATVALCGTLVTGALVSHGAGVRFNAPPTTASQAAR
jgi:hypothetical protein